MSTTTTLQNDDHDRLANVEPEIKAEILADGAEHDLAQARLRERYPQYLAMEIEPLPVIAIRVERVLGWGEQLKEPEGKQPGEIQ